MYFELEPSETFDPPAIVRACIESGAHGLLLDEQSLHPSFFDLSSGVAGDLVGRLSLYGLPMAAVVRDPATHSPHFREFAVEANRGQLFRFVATRAEAIAWLESSIDA